jgi:hypothetical protein
VPVKTDPTVKRDPPTAPLDSAESTLTTAYSATSATYVDTPVKVTIALAKDALVVAAVETDLAAGAAGTTAYVRIAVKDSAGNVIVTSPEVSVTGTTAAHVRTSLVTTAKKDTITVVLQLNPNNVAYAAQINNAVLIAAAIYPA